MLDCLVAPMNYLVCTCSCMFCTPHRLVCSPPFYLQHWPGFFLNAFSNDAHLEGLAQV